MASGPYQSNLLRFFVGQYWQGLARHQRALRETRSAIEIGGKIGAVAVLSPVVMISRVSQKRFRQLKQSATKLRCSLGRAQGPNKVLDFSGFDRLSAVADRLNLQALKPLLKPGSLSAEAEEMHASEADCEVSAAVKTVAITEAVAAEAIMAKTLLAVGSRLSSGQQNELTQGASRHPIVMRWWQSARALVSATLRKQMMCQSLESSEAQLEEAATRDVQVAGKITGVASDLETRSLVLIKNYRLAWNGLSAEQHLHLSQRIDELLADGSLTASEVREFALPSEILRKMGLPTAEKNHSVAIRAASFWVEVLRAVAWLTRNTAIFRRLPGRHLRLSDGAPLLADSGLGAARLGEGLVSSDGGAMVIQRRGFATRKSFHQKIARVISSEKLEKNRDINDWGSNGVHDYLEASVVTMGYAEHPLETVLNWVDRCLLWLEHGWRRLKHWMRQRSQLGQ
ncbi:MAG: hypothetical protein AAFO84_02305 [Cyanobacteria bacterium J06598_1]